MRCRTHDFLSINPFIPKTRPYTPHPKTPLEDRPLTSKQHLVMSYITHGYSQKQTAHALSLSEDSVKHLTSSVRRKLRAHNITHAAVIYSRLYPHTSQSSQSS